MSKNIYPVTKTLIFDMDGVLIDSEALHYETCRRVCAAAGCVLSRAEYDVYVGRPSLAMWRELIAERGLRIGAEELLASERVEHDNLLERERWYIPLVPGVREFLERCQSRGLAMAVASSAGAAFIQKMMQEHNLSGYFRALVSTEYVGHGKPAPDVFIYAAGCMQVRVADCIVIEDSANGVAAARAAGMFAVGYRNPNSGEQDFGAADLVVDSYEALADIIFSENII